MKNHNVGVTLTVLLLEINALTFYLYFYDAVVI